MSPYTLSLIEVLVPPENPWLKRLSKSKANLPAGVRVVRFDVDSDDGDDNLPGAPVAIDGQRPPAADSGQTKDVNHHA